MRKFDHFAGNLKLLQVMRCNSKESIFKSIIDRRYNTKRVQVFWRPDVIIGWPGLLRWQVELQHEHPL